MRTRALLAGTLIATAALSLSTMPEGFASPSPGLSSAIVKVFATASAPDLQRPWQRASMESGSGSGVILESGQILTNAHVVSNAVSIDVKLDGATERYPAEVAFISHANDLALLTVNDAAFFEGSRHLELGSMPRVQEAIEVFGYPEGGESMSITAGVVSRIEIGPYAHSTADLLLVQIDAAINPGNSGGPAVADDRLVGIATQILEDSQSIGYVIPIPVIRQFLEDTKDGRVDGPQTLGIGLQDLESPALRARYGLASKDSGALIIEVNHGAPAWGVLEPGDVMLALEGQPIANDLSISSDYGTRLHLTSALTMKQAGDVVKVQLVRNGKRLESSVRLHSWQPLIPGPNMSDIGRYRIFGGLVFQPLTADYLRIDPESYDAGMMNLWQYHNLRTPEQAEVVILSHVLPDESSRGYVDWYDEIVAHVQGQTPRDLAHLNEIIDSATGQWLEIEMKSGYRFVLDLKQSRRSTADLLARFSIAADRSPSQELAAAE